MFLKKFFLILALVTGCFYNCIAQHTDLTGTYTGKLYQGDKSYSYSITVKLKQTDNVITGTVRNETTGGSNSFVIYNIEGSVDGNTIEWKDISIADERSSSTWYWCKKQVRGKIIINNDSIELSGNWKNDHKLMFHKKDLVENSGVSCTPGSFQVSKENDAKVLNVDTIKKEIVKPQIKKTEDSSYLQREVNIKQKIEVVSDSIQLSFYDNGEVDNDTITVYYNNAVFLNRQRLSTKPLIITIPIQKNGSNELVMFANNEGDIPPNSALLVFTDNGIRREITMESTLKSSGSIIFIKK